MSGAAMSSLPDDIIAAIASSLVPEDVHHLMLTARVMYLPAVAELRRWWHAQKYQYFMQDVDLGRVTLRISLVGMKWKLSLTHRLGHSKLHRRRFDVDELLKSNMLWISTTVWISPMQTSNSVGIVVYTGRLCHRIVCATSDFWRAARLVHGVQVSQRSHRSSPRRNEVRLQ